MPQIPQALSNKKALSQHSTFHAPTDNSLMVEQNNSVA